MPPPFSVTLFTPTSSSWPISFWPATFFLRLVLDLLLLFLFPCLPPRLVFVWHRVPSSRFWSPAATSNLNLTKKKRLGKEFVDKSQGCWREKTPRVWGVFSRNRDILLFYFSLFYFCWLFFLFLGFWLSLFFFYFGFFFFCFWRFDLWSFFLCRHLFPFFCGF